jgi:hypothetical protein
MPPELKAFSLPVVLNTCEQSYEFDFLRQLERYQANPKYLV